MPTVTELAALYYGVDEITAASYLLGTANGGTNCNLDKQNCSKDDPVFHGPRLRLKNCDENKDWF